MDIATQRTHQVLAYLAAMEKQGALLTQNQLEKYARHPCWRVTTHNLLKSGFGIDSSIFSRTDYHETFVDYLQRMGWAHCKEDRSVHITPLGRAVLKHLDVPVVGPAEVPVEVVLSPDDPFAYAKALGAIADMGEVMIADPYFKAQQLIDISDIGTVARVLTSDKIGPAETTKLRALLTAVPNSRTLELRRAASFHDRFLIPDDGPVRGLGTSLNGVGKNHTIITTFGDETSHVVRRLNEDLWQAADRIEPAPRELRNLQEQLRGSDASGSQPSVAG
jgi:hypothetical protein